MTSTIILSCVISLGLAQGIKTIIKSYQNRNWNWKTIIETMVESGGMPSAHTAFVVSLCTALFFDQGITPLFIACVVFSLIIIRDSMGIRRAAGEHAKMINMLLHEFKAIKKNRQIQAKQVKVLLGHTPTQVIAGGILGLLVASIMYVI